MTNMGHIVFKTKDGVLVMNRESDISEWAEDTQTYILNSDARQKGVKILSIERDGKNFNCKVEWL
jgi:hypothetical protein